MRTHIRVLAFMVAATALGLLPAHSGYAAGFAVNSFADEADANLNDGKCRTKSGACTLRAAIQQANALGGAHSIALQAGTYTLKIPAPLVKESNSAPAAPAAGQGDLDIGANLTITGLDAGAVVDGGGLDRVFDIRSGASVSISNVRVRNGNPHGDSGGGIRNFGTLTLNSVSLTGNTASNGGGVRNSGSLTVTGSTLDGKPGQ